MLIFFDMASKRVAIIIQERGEENEREEEETGVYNTHKKDDDDDDGGGTPLPSSLAEQGEGKSGAHLYMQWMKERGENPPAELSHNFDSQVSLLLFFFCFTVTARETNSSIKLLHTCA